MDLFEKKKIPDVYSTVKYWENELTLYKIEKEGDSQLLSHKSYSIALIPDYLQLELANQAIYKEITHYQNNIGYAIKLKDGFDIDSYLKDQFKSNSRKIKKRHLRLESCFNISYKFFHGDIKEKEYQFLMNCLYVMLTRRFSQRKDKNEKLEEWPNLLEVTRNQISKKNASLLVIYDNNTPINISLNYHIHKIMFGAISSYDIDYYKFGLGSIEKIKLLEWCLSNGYKILEFGYGDLEYKRTWSNYMYNFKYQVIFDRKSFSAKAFSEIELLKLSIKEYLKSKKMDILFKRIKAFRPLRRKKEIYNQTSFDYERTTLNDYIELGELKKVDYEHEIHFPLKSIMIDFLYITIEHKDQVVVQKVVAEPNTFLISGRKNIHKITFEI